MAPLLLLAETDGWDDDEVFLFIGCAVATVLAVLWYVQCLRAVPSFGSRPAVRSPLLAATLLSFGAMVLVTWFWTAVEIRGGQSYMWLAFVMGSAWFGFYVRLFRWLGLDLREDACERTNPASILALCGAIPGGMLLYCGAICGEGPSFWNNVFTVLAGGAAWFALWLGLEFSTGISREVAEERDPGAGLRLAGHLLATGLLLGRASAGNWHSMEETLWVLGRDGWPALLLMGASIAAEFHVRRTTPRFSSSSPRGSLAIALGCLVFAAAWVCYLGPWEGMPR